MKMKLNEPDYMESVGEDFSIRKVLSNDFSVDGREVDTDNFDLIFPWNGFECCSNVFEFLPFDEVIDSVIF